MDDSMTPEEELELATNIANLKDNIAFYLKGVIHSLIIGLILIIGGFIAAYMAFTLLPYIMIGIGGITLYITYRFLYKWDWNCDVLAGIERSDYQFFINNP